MPRHPPITPNKKCDGHIPRHAPGPSPHQDLTPVHALGPDPGLDASPEDTRSICSPSHHHVIDGAGC